MKYEFRLSGVGRLWPATILVCLHIVYGYFRATELSNCNRNHMVPKAENIYYLDLYKQKSVDHWCPTFG